MKQKKTIKKSEFTPKKSLDPVDRRVFFIRNRGNFKTKSIDIPDLLLVINLVLKNKGLSEHIRLIKLSEASSEALSGTLKEEAIAEMLIVVQKETLETAKNIDSSISSIQSAE